MKKITLLILLTLFTGCLKRERVEERDKSRTDSALLVIEKMATVLSDSSESIDREIVVEERTPHPILSAKISHDHHVDTLVLEKTIVYVYSKKDSGGLNEIVLDSVFFVVDSCLHKSK